MIHTNCRIFDHLVLATLVGALAGCGGGDSSASSDGKWIEAPDAFSVFQADAKLQAMVKKSGPADTSCDAVIGDAREILKEPDTTGFKVIARTCGTAGMAFADDIRCKSGRMQVKCQ